MFPKGSGDFTRDERCTLPYPIVNRGPYSPTRSPVFFLFL